jgi:hypothetical protein
LEDRIDGGHEVDEATAHAKTDDSHAMPFDGVVTSQKTNGSVDVADHSSVAQTRSSSDNVIFAVGTVAVIEIRRRGHITGRRQPTRRVLDKFVDTALMLDDHHCRKGA